MNNELKGAFSPWEQPVTVPRKACGTSMFGQVERRFTSGNRLPEDELRHSSDIYCTTSPVIIAISPPVPQCMSFVPFPSKPCVAPSSKKRESSGSMKCRNNYFFPIVAFLTEFFSQRPCAIDDTFGVSQLHVVLAILRRKFGAKETSKSESKEAILAELTVYADLTRPFTPKRTEENNKFIFKHAIKLLKKELARDSLSPMSSAELDEAFLHKNFSAPDTDIETFKRAKTYSSLSLVTLRAIFKNAHLAAEFTRVLTKPTIEASPLVEAYTGVLHRKVVKIFRRWNKKLSDVHNVPTTVRELTSYFEKSTQCKLPWTVGEIVTAVQCFCDSVLATAPASR